VLLFVAIQIHVII